MDVALSWYLSFVYFDSFSFTQQAEAAKKAAETAFEECSDMARHEVSPIPHFFFRLASDLAVKKTHHAAYSLRRFSFFCARRRIDSAFDSNRNYFECGDSETDRVDLVSPIGQITRPISARQVVFLLTRRCDVANLDPSRDIRRRCC